MLQLGAAYTELYLIGDCAAFFVALLMAYSAICLPIICDHFNYMYIIRSLWCIIRLAVGCTNNTYV